MRCPSLDIIRTPEESPPGGVGGLPLWLGDGIGDALPLVFVEVEGRAEASGVEDVAGQAETLTELSQQAQVAPASMSQSVNRLTSAGYAIRSHDPNDGRKAMFSATSGGTEPALAARRQRNEWLDAQLQALSRGDQNTIARACVLLDTIAGYSG